MLASIPPQMSVSGFMGCLKGKSVLVTYGAYLRKSFLSLNQVADVWTFAGQHVMIERLLTVSVSNTFIQFFDGGQKRFPFVDENLLPFRNGGLTLKA